MDEHSDSGVYAVLILKHYDTWANYLLAYEKHANLFSSCPRHLSFSLTLFKCFPENRWEFWQWPDPVPWLVLWNPRKRFRRGKIVVVVVLGCAILSQIAPCSWFLIPRWRGLGDDARPRTCCVGCRSSDSSVLKKTQWEPNHTEGEPSRSKRRVKLSQFGKIGLSRLERRCNRSYHWRGAKLVNSVVVELMMDPERRRNPPVI